MKRMIMLSIISLALFFGFDARAERLELGLAATPIWLHDGAYEAFSESERYTTRFGLDIRSEVGSVSGFAFAPLLGYRFGRDTGYLTWDIDTALATHDLFAGLRVRRELIPWLSVFAELDVGAVIAAMDAEMYVDAYDVDPMDTYADRGATWSVGILAGVETHLSRRRLEARGNDWFCFGGEIAVGYVRRGDISFDPTLGGGGDNAIATDTLGHWGDVNLSGLILQFAASLYFI